MSDETMTRDDRWSEAERTLVAIAGTVGVEMPFDCVAKPRDVYLAVRRMAREHEAMRARLARIVDEAEPAGRLLRDVDGEDDWTVAR